MENAAYVSPDILVSVSKEGERRKEAFLLLHEAVNEGWDLVTSTNALRDCINQLHLLFPALNPQEFKSRWFGFFRECQILLKEIHSADLLDVERSIDFYSIMGEDYAIHAALATRYCKGSILSLDNTYDKAIGLQRICLKSE